MRPGPFDMFTVRYSPAHSYTSWNRCRWIAFKCSALNVFGISTIPATSSAARRWVRSYSRSFNSK